MSQSIKQSCPLAPFKALHLVALCLTVASCGGGGGNSGPDPRAAYLNVSVDRAYFGTLDVGTESAQSIELANWSGDKYPIKRLLIRGQDAEEFGIDFHGGIVLNPSERFSVDVSFLPVSNGLKNAMLQVEYDVVPLVSNAVNLNEQTYYKAKQLEDERQYGESLEQYRNYVQGDPIPVNKRRAAIKLPVLEESQRYGSEKDFTLYVSAVDLRDNGNTDSSLAALDQLLRDYPSSYLADDALYMKGYIQLMDIDQPEQSAISMAQLRTQHPDSSYIDTALYSEGLSLEEMGKTEDAAARFNELVDRHRSPVWASMSLNIAKDNYLSKLWFKRASTALQRLES